MTPSVPAASGAPAPLWRRAFDWWLVQVKHVLPPTIFFFFGFNLILFTRWMTLQEHGIPFTNFFAATLAALLVGKAVLVVDNLRFMHRFDGAPLIQPILFKSTIYWLCVFVFRLAEGSVCISCATAGSRRFPELPRRAILVAALPGDPDLADGAVPRLRDGPRAQYAVRRRRAAATVPALALVRGQAHKAPTYPPAHAAQPADQSQSDQSSAKLRGSDAHTPKLVGILRQLERRGEFRARRTREGASQAACGGLGQLTQPIDAKRRLHFSLLDLQPSPRNLRASGSFRPPDSRRRWETAPSAATPRLARPKRAPICKR